MMMVVVDLMMGVQGRISTTDGISAAIHHSPLIRESGRRDEAKVFAQNTQTPFRSNFIWNLGYLCTADMAICSLFSIFFLRC